MESKSGEFQVTAYWPATVSLWVGQMDVGCLAELGNGSEKVTVYSFYDFICKLPPGEEIELDLVPACCDTLPGSGIPCGAKPKAGLANPPKDAVYQTATPEDPDRREIPELVARINTDMFNIPFAERLAKFMDDSDFEEDIAKYETQIRKAYHQMPEGYLKTEVTKLWLDTDAGEKMLADRGDAIDDDALLKGLTVHIYDKQLPETLQKLRNKPRSPEKFLPVLADRLYDISALRRVGTDETDRELFLSLMDTIEAFGPAAKDYLQRVYFAVNTSDVFDVYGLSKEARLAALMSGKNIPAYGRPASYRKNSVANGDDEIAAIVVPRFEKLVCVIAPPASGSRESQITWDSSAQAPSGYARKPVNTLPPPVVCD